MRITHCQQFHRYQLNRDAYFSSAFLELLFIKMWCLNSGKCKTYCSNIVMLFLCLFSGGILLTVIGSSLDVVQDSIMIVTLELALYR
jgi:hypothetical protein